MSHHLTIHSPRLLGSVSRSLLQILSMSPLPPGTKEAGVWVHATDRSDVIWFSSLWTCHTRDNKVGYYLAEMRRQNWVPPFSKNQNYMTTKIQNRRCKYWKSVRTNASMFDSLLFNFYSTTCSGVPVAGTPSWSWSTPAPSPTTPSTERSATGTLPQSSTSSVRASSSCA